MIGLNRLIPLVILRNLNERNIGRRDYCNF